MLKIILATRGRPALLKRTLEVTLGNVTEPDTYIYVAVDADDAETMRAINHDGMIYPRVTYQVDPRADSLGEKYNRIVMAPTPDADTVYLAMVDYAPHVTPGFDRKILDAAAMYSDGYAVVYNRHANLSFPGINAVTRKLAWAMGGMYPALYPYWFVDHHLDDIAQMIGRVVFADVVIDTGAREEKPGKPWTQGRRETWFWALLFDALAKERSETARKIIGMSGFDETPDRKRVLINNIPLIAHHSMMVNSAARQMVGEDTSTDEWYARVKAAGLAKLAQVVPPEVMAQVEGVHQKLAA